MVRIILVIIVDFILTLVPGSQALSAGQPNELAGSEPAVLSSLLRAESDRGDRDEEIAQREGERKTREEERAAARAAREEQRKLLEEGTVATVENQDLKVEHGVEPVYPPISKMARIQGNVVLEVKVDENGAVSHIRVVQGHPLLVKAALEAVNQWRFEPSPILPTTTRVTLQFRHAERASRSGDGLYEQGARALDERRWERAIGRFDSVIEGGGSRADGAMYWKAYAQNKQGDRAAALATLEKLVRSYPQSRWLADAKALEVEVRQGAGQKVSPEAVTDEDLKLLALNSLMNSDPDRALPVLEKFLQGSQPVKLKERALFVLTQSRSPRAREIVTQIARGNSNPDLQRKAIEYLGLFGGKESRQALADIYGSVTDVDVKRRILRSFMVGGERDRLLAVAKSEKDAELRAEAIRQLGVMGAQNELWQLYQQEPSGEIKKRILQSMFVGGNAEKLLEVARNEKDSELRSVAIRNLGLMGRKSGDGLVSIYTSDKDTSVRHAIINALFLQNNAKGLVDIARKETDPELKKQAISKLSLMHSKEGTEYLLELLNK